jgi:hypothetical protein
MRRKLMALAILAGSVLGASAYAHHSVAATYIVDKEITIDATVIEFMYANPHSFLKVQSRDIKGGMQTWAIEWGGVLQLSREGVLKDSLKPGDRIIVSGNPARQIGDHRIRAHSIYRPYDRWKWAGRAASNEQEANPAF